MQKTPGALKREKAMEPPAENNFERDKPMAILSADGVSFESIVPVLIIGGGACGLTAALAAKEGGVDPLVLERDAKPTGSTSLSSGLIPAAGTREQRRKGIEDSAELFASDIVAKAKNQTDPDMAMFVAQASGPTVDWLEETHGLEFRLVEGFLYPGHSVHRMHGPDTRMGADLEAGLLRATQNAGIDIMSNAHVQNLYADIDGRIRGVRIDRTDGSAENVGCDALVLACNGYGGNPAMVKKYIPEIAEAPYFGHVGNQGDAVKWGLELGAAVADMGSYQGHGAVAHPQGMTVIWCSLSEGGFQVNTHGKRFSHENRGYSEQALDVVNQPGQVAWIIYDERCQEPGLDFSEYRRLREMGGVKSGDSVAELAARTSLPVEALKQTFEEVGEMVRGNKEDPFGRDFTGKPALEPPYLAAQVTGALFHTQGGLVIDDGAWVMLTNGTRHINLFAGGGAARGLSGPSRWGYLSGNGLLTATTLGRIAGTEAAKLTAAAGSA